MKKKGGGRRRKRNERGKQKKLRSWNWRGEEK
jgi:hypothetical protein